MQKLTEKELERSLDQFVDYQENKKELKEVMDRLIIDFYKETDLTLEEVITGISESLQTELVYNAFKTDFIIQYGNKGEINQ